MNETIAYLKSILKDNDTIVIGLSGGPDSMCLLSILENLPIKLNIVCAHINHNIRKESEQEASFLKEYCANKNIAFEYTKFEKKSENIDYTEAELREKRYQYFAEIIKKHNAKYLFTAHHGDDLIETILMRITRGSNIKGYAGFQIATDKKTYQIIKPLIYLTKDEILEYNKQNNIPSFNDVTNTSNKYTRNRYRQNILPFLKEENKNIHMKYLKFSKELYDYYNFVDEEVKKELKKRYKDKVLDITNYNKLNPLIQNKIIESVLDDNYIDNLYLVSDKHTYLILSLINNEKPNLEIDLPDNLKIKKSYNKLTITRKNNAYKKYHIIINKLTILPTGRVIETVDSSDLTNNYCTRLNSKELKLPLFVRNREEGDKMVIKNMKNNKKLKDIFIDSKLTKEERETQPVVVDSDNNIIWLPGLKKSQFDKAKTENYDIILWYN